MKPRPTTWLRGFLLLLAAAIGLPAGIVTGASVYSKRYETTLLADPQPLAKATAKIPLGRKLKVEEVKGVWLRVSDGSAGGWVFSGNVADKKPEEIKGADGLPLEASKTTATAAGRPLTPAASDYANRRNLGNARGDLDWLLEQCNGLTPDDLDDFLQKQKKGEYQ